MRFKTRMNEKLLKNIIRINIDLNQAVNYIIDSKYREAVNNLNIAVNTIQNMVNDIEQNIRYNG